MHNPSLYEDNALVGSLGLWVVGADNGNVTMLRGWPRARWWTSALRFWDDFSADGALGPESAELGPVGAVCLQRTVTPGATADFTFLLSWHFPNRTPDRCGWDAAGGEGGARIGNHYCTRFADAWAAALFAAAQLSRPREAHAALLHRRCGRARFRPRSRTRRRPTCQPS